MKLKSRFFAVVALLSVMVTGCGSSSAAASIDPSALADSLVSGITYEEQLAAVSDDDISYYFEDLADGVTCIMYMGDGGKTAEEVAVFTAPDESTAAATKECVQTFLDDQKESFKAYIPEAAKRVEDAVLEQKGNYVVLCVSDDSNTAKDLINKAFEK